MKHLAALLAVFTLADSAWAQRVALVIGNNAYTGLPARMQLTSPVSDAADVAAALRKLGYRLIGDGPVSNASREAMTAAAEKFAAAARGAETAVFYYSGHGIQVGDDNYLLPTDTPSLNGLSMLKNRGVLLRDSIMVALEEARAGTKVIILDCCRDNPFAAQLDAALAQIGKSVKTKSVGEITGYGPGFYLAFATSPGQTALDGNGRRNSPFTEAMLKTLAANPESAGKDVDFFFRDVKAILPDDQVSWTNHSLKASFSLAPGAKPFTLPSFPMPSPKTAAERTAAERIAAATKEAPFANSLGQEFVPVPGTGVLMCRTETTRGAWREFIRDAGRDMSGGMTVLKIGPDGKHYNWKHDANASWEAPGFVQTDEHPLVGVSWEDARAFCAWLSKKEGVTYRLPGDAEWNKAVGTGKYPWGASDTPPAGAGNYAGEESKAGMPANWGFIAGYRDNAKRTDVVGNYTANRLGIHDLGGNVWEWCEDEYKASLNSDEVLEKIPAMKTEKANGGTPLRVLRGASWRIDGSMNLRSSFRTSGPPTYRSDNFGFRLVVVSGR